MVELLAAKTHTGDAVARRVTSAQTLYAPYVLDGEVVSALLGLMRGQKISEREADAALSSYRAFPVERQDVLPLWPRLKSLHANLSAYDAQYVALAEALHVPLVTADARVKRSGAADARSKSSTYTPERRSSRAAAWLVGRVGLEPTTGGL